MLESKTSSVDETEEIQVIKEVEEEGHRKEGTPMAPTTFQQSCSNTAALKL